jgi:hypothetical protein
MPSHNDLTQELVCDLFEYRDGELFWKKSGKGRKFGVASGNKRKDGYTSICINYKDFLLHRLVFLYHKGYMPNTIDHIDGNPENNKIENLRECSQSENLYNRTNSLANISGYKNVYRNHNRWEVKIRINKTTKYLGRYDDLELADLVATEARNKYHKEFAKHGNKE